MSTEKLLDTLSRYDSKRKAESNCRELNEINFKKMLKKKIFQEMNYVKLKRYKINQ